MQTPLSPSILLAAAALAIVAGLFFRLRLSRKVGLGLFVVVIIAANVPGLSPAETVLFSSHNVAFVEDGLARSEHWIVVAFGLLSAIAIVDMPGRRDDGLVVYGFLLFAFAGILFAVRANDFVSLGLSLEIVHRALRELATHLNSNPISAVPSDSSLEELPFQRWKTNSSSPWDGSPYKPPAAAESERSPSSGSTLIEPALYWLGVALLACVTAATDFDSIRKVLILAYDPGPDQNAIGSPSKLLLLSVGLIVSSLCARLGLFPFRLIVGDSRKQIPSTSEGITQIGMFLAASVALIRLFGITFIGMNPALTALLMTICLVNFLLAAVSAVRCLSQGVASIPYWQWSTGCLQTAWLLVGLMIVSNELRLPRLRWGSFGGQAEATSVCVLVQLSGLLTLGCFYWTLGHLSRSDRKILYMEDLRGLIRYAPGAALSLIVATACAIGFPLTLGFWSRWLTLLSGHSIHSTGASKIFVPNAGLRITMFVGLMATAVAAGAAIRMLREIAFEAPLGQPKAMGGKGSLISGSLAAITILLLGSVPQIALVPLKSIGVSRPIAPNSTQRGSGRIPLGQVQPETSEGIEFKAAAADDQ